MLQPMSRLTVGNSVLLVVDVQEKLLAVMPDAPGLVRNVALMLDVANTLHVPTFVTEQYPQGLGPTHPDLLQRFTGERPAKVGFSCSKASGLVAQLRASGAPNVLVVGMEAHVCILQTVLDLLVEGFHVFVAVDAVQARFALDQELALKRMERAGAILTTVETVAFEWLGGADHPQFKTVSKLVQQRMKALRGE